MRSDRLLLEDIREAIEEVIGSTPATRAQFDADKFCRSHLLRQLQIIGEASRRLSNALKDRHPQVPWRQIVGMRHVLVHDYFEVDWNEVYNVVLRDVPALKPQIETILAAFPSEES